MIYEAIGGGVYIMNIGSLETERLFVGEEPIIVKAIWSPTGEWIAYNTDGTYYPPDVFAVRPNKGAERIQLTSDDYRETLIGWSPDGQEVLFWSARDGVTGLYAINVETQTTRGMAQSPPDFQAAYISPDRQYIIVSPYDHELESRWKLYLLNVQTGQLRTLHDEWFALWGLSWAPDSTTIAFGAKGFDESTEGGVYLMDVISNTYRVLATSIGEEYVMGEPSWSPDGKKLAFLGDPSPWVYNFETRELTKLLPGATRKTPVQWYSPMLWSPRLKYEPNDCQ